MMTQKEVIERSRGCRLFYSGSHPDVLRLLNYHGYFAEVIRPTGQLLRRDYPQGRVPIGVREPHWPKGLEDRLEAV